MGGPWSRRGAAGFAVVLLVLLLAFGWRLGTFDFDALLQGARAVRAGHGPYPPLSSAVFRTGHGFVYPDLVAWAFAPFTLVPRGWASGCAVVVSVAAVVGGCALLGRRGPAPAALVLVASTTIVGLQMGTLNALFFLGLAAAWAHRDRVQVVGVVVAMVALGKLFLLPMIVWLVATRRYRAAAVASAVFVTALGLGFVVGPLGPAGYAHLLSVLQGNEAARSWSLTSLLSSVGFGRLTTEGLVGATALGVLAGGWWRLRRTGDERVMFGAAVVAGLLLSPIVWSSYLLLLEVPLLLVTVDDRPIGVAAVVSWVLVVPDAVDGPRIGIGVGLAVALTVVTWRRCRPAPVPAGPGRTREAPPPWRRGTVAVLAVALTTGAWLLAPPRTANALPALAAVTATLARGVRPGAPRPRAPRPRAAPG